MNHNLPFINNKDLLKHIEETIRKYEGNLISWNLKKFNKNKIDPIKMVFDKTVNNFSWEEIIENEIFRQRDKSNTNAIGYFHQNIFKYIKHCKVPEYGWDIIYEPTDRIEISKGVKVKRIKVEMKNKHNTMNSSSKNDLYNRCIREITKDPDCATFLVEVITPTSKNQKWEKNTDGRTIDEDRIRIVSIDEFYEIVTGQEDAFYQLCMKLPKLVDFVFKNSDDIEIERDTVFDELNKLDDSNDENIFDEVLGESLFTLAFYTYKGFKDN